MATSSAQHTAGYKNDVPDPFYAAVLKDLGVPVTQLTMEDLKLWHSQEGSNYGANNPLNITSGAGVVGFVRNPGSSAGVGGFDTAAHGEQATANFLKQKYYTDIVAQLHDQNPLNSFATAVESSPWAGGHYGATGTKGGSLWQAATAFENSHPGFDSTASGKTYDAGVAVPQGITGGVATGLVNTAVSAVDSVPKFLGAITDPKNLIRAALIIVGVGLVIVGVSKLSGGSAPSAPAPESDAPAQAPAESVPHKRDVIKSAAKDTGEAAV